MASHPPFMLHYFAQLGITSLKLQSFKSRKGKVRKWNWDLPVVSLGKMDLGHCD